MITCNDVEIATHQITTMDDHVEQIHEGPEKKVKIINQTVSILSEQDKMNKRKKW